MHTLIGGLCGAGYYQPSSSSPPPSSPQSRLRYLPPPPPPTTLLPSSFLRLSMLHARISASRKSLSLTNMRKTDMCTHKCTYTYLFLLFFWGGGERGVFCFNSIQLSQTYTCTLSLSLSLSLSPSLPPPLPPLFFFLSAINDQCYLQSVHEWPRERYTRRRELGSTQAPCKFKRPSRRAVCGMCRPRPAVGRLWCRQSPRPLHSLDISLALMTSSHLAVRSGEPVLRFIGALQARFGQGKHFLASEVWGWGSGEGGGGGVARKAFSS